MGNDSIIFERTQEVLHRLAHSNRQTHFVFLPIVVLLIPVYKVNGAGVNLISIIKIIISDSASVFQNKAMLLCFISFAAVILTSLVCAVISLFSYTKTDISEI